ncbi:MAG: pentapeptide repeat-containing protein [Rhodobacteraceae bacterium]|nr:pentapeptide repeat-containing protein [Paracoccaceae bacterium]
MPADSKTRIERINQVSAMARTSWIALLGYLAFVGVTLLGVEDADFFVPSRQTQLPLVNVSIPTASFFLFAPILATALYVYLHIILLKLWDAIADLEDPVIDGQPVGDALVPWLVNDWALSVRGGPFLPARPLRALGNLASFLLVWAAAPLALFFFWWWSMPAHRPFLTLFLAACFLIALTAGITGWQTAHAWLSGNRPPPSGQSPLWTALRELLRSRDPARARALAAAFRDSLRRHAALWALGLLLAYVSLVRTVWPTADRPPLARANVSNVELVDLPAGWRDWETARTAFRETWCRREGLDMSVCGQPSDADRDQSSPQVTHDRGAWCSKHDIEGDAPCNQTFARLDARFDEDWDAERRSAIADLPQLDLRGADLRSIQGQGVTLVGANLVEARLEGANLRGARLEGANLRGARLEGADLRGARLEGANLIGAQLEGANLWLAGLEAANLGMAQLERADLRGALLERADLRGARLEGANLWLAGLEGADLWLAGLEGADLRRSDFRKSDWSDASTRASPAQFADLRGVLGLTQAQLDNLIGNEGTLLPEGVSETGEPWHVWSCWETPPEGLDALVARTAEPVFADPEVLRADFLCSPDNPRRKTGTPLPLDAPYPPGHPLADR